MANDNQPSEMHTYIKMDKQAKERRGGAIRDEKLRKRLMEGRWERVKGWRALVEAEHVL